MQPQPIPAGSNNSAQGRADRRYPVNLTPTFANPEGIELQRSNFQNHHFIPWHYFILIYYPTNVILQSPQEHHQTTLPRRSRDN